MGKVCFSQIMVKMKLAIFIILENGIGHFSKWKIILDPALSFISNIMTVVAIDHCIVSFYRILYSDVYHK